MIPSQNVFEGDMPVIELVLQIVLEKVDLKVLNVCTQVFMENFPNRSVRLDILTTTDSINKLWAGNLKTNSRLYFFQK